MPRVIAVEGGGVVVKLWPAEFRLLTTCNATSNNMRTAFSYFSIRPHFELWYFLVCMALRLCQHISSNKILSTSPPTCDSVNSVSSEGSIHSVKTSSSVTSLEHSATSISDGIFYTDYLQYLYTCLQTPKTMLWSNKLKVEVWISDNIWTTIYWSHKLF